MVPIQSATYLSAETQSGFEGQPRKSDPPPGGYCCGPLVFTVRILIICGILSFALGVLNFYLSKILRQHLKQGKKYFFSAIFFCGTRFFYFCVFFCGTHFCEGPGVPWTLGLQSNLRRHTHVDQLNSGIAVHRRWTPAAQN